MMSQKDTSTTDPLGESDGDETVESNEIPEEVADLFERIQNERDEAVEARTRALADYANFQRRASENESRARDEGMTEVVRSLIPVLDQFDLALDHESQEATADSLIKGIQIVKNELLKVLDKAGIVPIEPKIGDSFDPNLHEAMLKQPTDDVAPGHISLLIQPGWAFGVMVIRPAKVAIAPEDE